MHIKILCVGRMKGGPERDMVDDYLHRAARTGKPLGIRSVEEVEVEAGGGMAKEADRLLSKAGAARLIRLDERGKQTPSVEFSRKLAQWRDNGEDVVFMIGGADGFDASIKKSAPDAICFGVQTWPHKLVRVLIAEQIYRALSIEAGTPYHRA